MILTDHAQQRMRQRGINHSLLELLLAYGCETHDHHGGRILYLDKQARKTARSELGHGAVRKFDRVSKAYAVLCSDETVVTVGHRFRRVKNY